MAKTRALLFHYRTSLNRPEANRRTERKRERGRDIRDGRTTMLKRTEHKQVAEKKKTDACSPIAQQTRGGLTGLKRSSIHPSLFLLLQIPCCKVCGTVENIIPLHLNIFFLHYVYTKDLVIGVGLQCPVIKAILYNLHVF